MYTLTLDEHFIIDRLSEFLQTIVTAGFSGHGFTFASVGRESLAELATDGESNHDISMFSISRFLKE